MLTALQDLDHSIDALMQTRVELLAVRGKAEQAGDAAGWQHHEYRMSSTIAQIKHIRETGATLAPLLMQLNKLIRTKKNGAGIDNAGILAIRGGIAMVTATNYGAENFIKNIGKKKPEATRQGIFGLASWLTVGKIMGTKK